MSSSALGVQDTILFGDGFELDIRLRRLRRGGRVLKLERIPLEILVLLVERSGEVVTREEIVSRVWGPGAVFDTDNSIRGAIRKLRQVLKDDAESPEFIQTVTGQGYRFIARVFSHDAEEDPSNLSTTTEDNESTVNAPVAASAEGRPRTLPSNQWIMVGGAVVLVLVTITYLATRHRAGQSSRPKSLAVLPLKNLSGDSTQEYLADGITEALIGRLAAIHDLRVVSRTSAMRFKETRLSVPEISKALGVDALVEGSVIREGNHIRVHAQLIRGATDEHFWSESYDRELGDVLELESDVAQAIAGKVEATITGQERSRLVASRHIAPEVYESYLKGRYALRKSNNLADLQQTIGYFEEAIDKDPRFVGAYLGLAEAYNEVGLVFVGGRPLEARAKVVEAARKALELDPELAEAHVQLAEVYLREWRWSESEAEYKRALQLRPNDAAAHAGMSRWLLAQGRVQDAMEWSKRARELDPLAISGTELAWILFSARRYDEAIRELRSTLAVRPDDAFALWYLGFSLIGEGKPDEAIVPLQQAVSLTHRSPGVLGLLARAYGHGARRSEALRLIGELKQRREKSYVPTAPFIQAYVGLGDYDQVFAWFDEAYKEKSNILVWIKVEPFPDAMRNDPRFAELIHRVGLDQAR